MVRGSEELLRIVPNELREASYALGVPKWLTIVKIVLPTSIAGIVTSIMLAIARVIGETAPLLLTAGMTMGMNTNLFDGQMMTLPVFAYNSYMNQGTTPDAAVANAWGAALALVTLIVMVLNLVARLIAKIFAPKMGADKWWIFKGITLSKSIEVNDLNVYYGDFLAVEGVSIHIQPRTVTAFIGPSGCGKSTFLRTLNRMHEVIPGARVAGEVLMDGKNLYDPGVDPVTCADRWAWCSSVPTRSPRCRSATTCWPG